mmetsp:Transcript_30292/g.29791  ORF Transcript_30292/g.29791 Transcript_30292/m.29791 type:complete len:242 (+) Transcript_30292:364-1089(+)
MVTTGTDSRMKVWDLRKYECVHDYFTRGPAFATDISQKGLLSVTYGNTVEVWKDWEAEKQKEPYMSHKVQKGSSILTCKFSPFEDFLGLGHYKGFSSIIVPGSGEANYTFEAMAPRKEALVHEVLEKLQPSTISLDQAKIGTIDRASKEIKEQERKEELAEWMSKKKTKEKKKKTKGRQKIGRTMARSQRQQFEKQRDSMRQEMEKKYNKDREEKELIHKDLAFLEGFAPKKDEEEKVNDE